MKSPARAFIALGANIVHPAEQIRQAIARLSALPQTRLVCTSSLYSSAPVGYADQPDFINAVAEISTTLPPHRLLEAMQTIENELGRERSIPNGPRTIDLDLILYGDQAIAGHELQVPHPRMHERAFVLVPLCEIDPELNIPGHGAASALLASVAGQALRRLPC